MKTIVTNILIDFLPSRLSFREIINKDTDNIMNTTRNIRTINNSEESLMEDLDKLKASLVANHYPPHLISRIVSETGKQSKQQEETRLKPRKLTKMMKAPQGVQT